MADKKEIIIDGVDVSKCYAYVHNAKDYDCGETYSKFHYRYCEENPNCYFKQLKRKEQECEELHSRTASIIYYLTGGRLSYSTYTLEGCEDAYRDQLSIDVERATKELEGKNETLKQEVNTLGQALDEIEKQVKAINNECFYDDICDCNNCDMKNGCTYQSKIKILQKISEMKECKIDLNLEQN